MKQVDSGKFIRSSDLRTLERALRYCGLAALLLLGGCVPMSVAWSPSLDGKVIDAESKQGVAGAKVWAKSCPEQAVTTAMDGGFLLKQCHEKTLTLYLMHIYPREIQVNFEAPGHSSTLRWFGHDRRHIVNVIMELHRR